MTDGEDPKHEGPAPKPPILAKARLPITNILAVIGGGAIIVLAIVGLLHLLGGGGGGTQKTETASVQQPFSLRKLFGLTPKVCMQIWKTDAADSDVDDLIAALRMQEPEWQVFSSLETPACETNIFGNFMGTDLVSTDDEDFLSIINADIAGVGGFRAPGLSQTPYLITVEAYEWDEVVDAAAASIIQYYNRRGVGRVRKTQDAVLDDGKTCISIEAENDASRTAVADAVLKARPNWWVLNHTVAGINADTCPPDKYMAFLDTQQELDAANDYKVSTDALYTVGTDYPALSIGWADKQEDATLSMLNNALEGEE